MFSRKRIYKRKVKAELDLFTYTTKADLKNATGVDSSKFAKKVDLANIKSNIDQLYFDKLKNIPSSLRILKSKVDNLDIGKLETIPVHLSKLSNAVKNDVVKKTEYNAKIKILKIKYFATKTTLNAKINDVKGEIPNITHLATTAALTTVENKIPNVSNLVKKN